MASLRDFRSLRKLLLAVRRRYLVARYGLAIEPSAQVSLSAKFLPAGRGSIVIGANTLVAFRTLTIAQDDALTSIGANCFIGGGAMVLAGVTIGDNTIVGAGAVVMEDVPPSSIVIGNPARVVRKDVQVGPYGRLPEADANTMRYFHGIEPSNG